MPRRTLSLTGSPITAPTLGGEDALPEAYELPMFIDAGSTSGSGDL